MYGSECERLNVKRRPQLHRMETFLHASHDQLSHPIQDEQCALWPPICFQYILGRSREFSKPGTGLAVKEGRSRVARGVVWDPPA